MDPLGVAKFDPRDIIGLVCNGDYQTLLHTKYKSFAPCGFREDFFFSFSHCKSMGTINSQGVAKFDSWGMAGTVYVADHKPLPHTKYQSCGPSENKNFDFCFHYHIYAAMSTRISVRSAQKQFATFNTAQ